MGVNTLTFNTSLDGSGFQRGINAIENQAKTASSRLSAAVHDSALSKIARGGVDSHLFKTHGQSGVSGVVGESLVLLREFGRGNFSRIPGSITILFQRLGLLGVVLKSTAQGAIEAAAAESVLAQSMARTALVSEAKALAARRELLATGMSVEAATAATAANFEEAAGLRAAALAQQQKAEIATESAEIEAAAGSTTITTLGWIGIAVVAVGAALYFFFKHMQKVSEEEKNLKELTDIATLAIDKQGDAFRQAREHGEEFVKWLNKVKNGEEDVQTAMDETIRVLRERGNLERQLAQSRGASKSELANMELEQLEKELELTKKLADAQLGKVGQDEQDAINLQTMRDQFDKNDAANLKAAQEAQKNAAEVVAALQKKIAGGAMVAEITGYTSDLYGASIPNYETRNVNGKDILSVSVGGKDIRQSLEGAQAELDRVTQEASRLASIEKEITDALEDKKKLTDKDKEKLDKLIQERDRLEKDLGLKREFLPQIANSADDKRGLKNPPISSDSLTSVGNFLGSSKSMIESLAQRQVDLLSMIEVNTRQSKITEFPSF